MKRYGVIVTCVRMPFPILTALRSITQLSQMKDSHTKQTKLYDEVKHCLTHLSDGTKDAQKRDVIFHILVFYCHDNFAGDITSLFCTD